MLDCALVTVETDPAADDGLLILVDLGAKGISIQDHAWQSPALAAAATATVRFDDVHVPPEGLVGAPGFYLDRPGFWFGAVGVAAVWLGGAEAIAATVRSAIDDDPHALAHLGAIDTACWGARAALDAAADAIDADPVDASGEGSPARPHRPRDRRTDLPGGRHPRRKGTRAGTARL